ncbi:MAG: hypothetical protein J6W75_13105 [Bacteroidaceae bacterium]|nr:hypothetical protein [Bacteroidaceae bacterium]
MNKKISFLVAALMLLTSTAQAQKDNDKFFFNHLGVGVSLGTDGIGIEAATPVTPFVGLRAGVSFFPKISVSDKTFNYSRHGREAKGKVDGSFKKIDGKLLVDIYPFGNKYSVHVTGGLFVGNDEFVTATVTEGRDAQGNVVGFEGYVVPAKDNPNGYAIEPGPASETLKSIKAKLTYNKVKPYVGIGFGRMVPKPGKRIGVSCDIGVQFHNKPEVLAYSWEGKQYMSLTAGDVKSLIEGEDKTIDDAFDIKNKVICWPVLNIRLTGRIF